MENQNQQPKPFCVAPFVNFYYKGSKSRSLMRPCCESRTDDDMKYSFNDYDSFWHGDFMKSLRQDMLDGKPHDICTRCIEVEDAGGLNSREFYDNILKRFEREYGKVSFNADTGNQHGGPISIDYRGSNLCNLKCRMCHVSSSSEIAKEILEHEEVYKTVQYHSNKEYLYVENKDVNTFINQIPLENTFRIKFLGGEPLMQEDVYQGLEKVLKESRNPKKVDISFTTNATNFPPRFINLIGKFKQILMRVSLDGVGATHEYVRTNSNWAATQKNCAKIFDGGYDNREIVLGFSFIIQAYSIFNIIDILEYIMDIKSKKYEVWSEPFFSPIEQDWMSTAILDDADIAEVLAQLDAFKLKYTKQTYSDNIKNIIENFDKKRKINVEEARTKFKEFTNVMDSVRKTDLSKLDERFKKYL